ncbi:hypothetical protein, partial [[Ruminococcus] torques]|uniref:hypothetical protein n=1 Tax=[Ruminococcus] torques TaxID=33039 RepID=UPI001EE062F9
RASISSALITSSEIFLAVIYFFLVNFSINNKASGDKTRIGIRSSFRENRFILICGFYGA